MPRRARSSADDQVFHVLNRGNCRMNIFGKPGDYAAFIKILEEGRERTRMRILAETSKSATPISKVHALWALQGIDSLEDGVAADATKDPDPRVRLPALRSGGSMIRKRTAPALIKAMASLADDPDPAVQVEVLSYRKYPGSSLKC